MASAITNTVNQLLSASPVKQRPKRTDQGRRLTKAESDRIKELSDADMTTIEIAKRLGVERSTVYRHKRK